MKKKSIKTKIPNEKIMINDDLKNKHPSQTFEMVLTCCVRRCKSEAYFGSGISFHRLPKNAKLRQKWIDVVPGNVTKYSAVCGLHFTAEDFATDANALKKRLKFDAIPSIFSKGSDNVLTTQSHKAVNDNVSLTLPPPIQNIECDNVPSTFRVLSHKVVNDNISLPLRPPAQNIDFANEASNSSNHENVSIHSDDSVSNASLPSTTKQIPENKNEAPFKRRALKDFNVEANLKTSRELHLGKRVKILQQEVKRQGRNINDMKSHINVVQDYADSESDHSENGDGDGEMVIFIGRCKCCLIEGDLKNMWTPYTYEGETEIYGMMLTECFALSWQQPDENMGHMDMICTSCISRLRDALAFKREVLVSEEVLRENQDKILLYTTLKVEKDLKEEEEETEFNEVEYLEITDSLNNDELYEEPLSDEQSLSSDNSLLVERKRKLSKKLPKQGRNKTYKQYTEEELQMAIDAVQNNEMSHAEAAELFNVPRKTISAKINNIIDKEEEQSQSPEENRKRKWPKKLPYKDRNKTYKQYTEKALRMAIDAVQNKGMSRTQASEKFKVPKKTLDSRLRIQNTIAKNEEPDDDDTSKIIDQEKHYKLIEEIKSILTYTNAIPYKSKLSRYYCAYCSTDGPAFDDPDDLRTHTKTKHVDNRTKGIDQLMRPHWLNEVLKIDIHSLHCTVCCTILPTWNDMFRHLEDVHEVVLDEAYNRVIPYVLARELKCALCEDAFPNYHTLDGHMNAHYSSYICYECGDTFLSANRLNKHVKVHSTGTFPCEACGKVYNLKRYMTKHFAMVHGQKDQYKCSYCPERFSRTFQRHQHVLEKHKETIKIKTCEICGKTFDWMPYFSAHMRRKHGKERNANRLTKDSL